MKRKFSALALAFMMVLSAFLQPIPAQAKEVSGDNYVVTLPDGYDEARNYPVVYVMPQNGYDADDSGIVEKYVSAMVNGVSTEMIIVRPEFDEGENLHAVMEAMVTEIDANYSTIADADHRAIVGTGVGGYLAYILGLTEVKYVEVEVEEQEETAETSEETDTTTETDETIETNDLMETAGGEVTTEKQVVSLTKPALFKSVASIRGDFVSENNAWYSIYGSVLDRIQSMKYMDKVFDMNTWQWVEEEVDGFTNFYTYIDAPVNDSWTNMTESTNDIGSYCINQGFDSSTNEFTVRTGAFSDAFITESVNRVADRINTVVMNGVVSGTVKLTNAALVESVEKAEASYSIDVKSVMGSYTEAAEDIVVMIEVIDPSSGVVLASASEEKSASANEKVTGTLEIDNIVNGTYSNVQLSVNVLGVKINLATVSLARIQNTVVDEENQYIDLMGDWYFNFTGSNAGLDVQSLIDTKEYEAWSVVQPALAWWKAGFGNITSEYFSIGDGYYVRTFEVPENFDAEKLVLSVGYMDDRGQVYVNGKLVGETGMVDGAPSGDTTWAVYSYFELDPAVLNKNGTNTIVVRCQNDGVGGGGWYAGPIAIYSEKAFAESQKTQSLFEEHTFTSEAVGADKEYLVYLPSGYYESEKYYPTMYLMHQFNSDHTSYMTDNIDGLVDEAIKQALIDEMIVIVPNSSEMSFWSGDYETMVTDELVPLIDSTYRTIDDARYRFTAGCSMGGQGAYNVALQNPELFAGATSFFGAFSYGDFFPGSVSPNSVVASEDAEYLDYFTMYFICGNQDSYKFGVPAISLHKALEAKGVDHEFFIENGAHDSAFYVPYFVEAMIYMRDNMYKSDDVVGTLMSGNVVADGAKLTVDFKALAGIEAYYNLIPDSSYTVDGTPDLSLPLIIEVVQDGDVVFKTVERDHVINTGAETSIFTYDLTDVVDASKEYAVTYKVAVFDKVVELKNVKVVNGVVADEKEDDNTSNEPGITTPSKPSTDKNDTVDTGDHAPIALYLGLALTALVAMAVAIKLRRRA